MKEKASSRIAAAKRRNPKLFGHIKRDRGYIEEVKDRRTGVPLMSKQDVGEKVVVRNGKRVTEVRVEVRPTAQYAELTIEMDDGTLHQTFVAKSELNRGWGVEELGDIYASDLEQWAADGMDEDLLEKYAARTPLKVVR